MELTTEQTSLITALLLEADPDCDKDLITKSFVESLEYVELMGYKQAISQGATKTMRGRTDINAEFESMLYNANFTTNELDLHSQWETMLTSAGLANPSFRASLANSLEALLIAGYTDGYDRGVKEKES